MITYMHVFSGAISCYALSFYSLFQLFKREYNLTLVRHWLYTVNEELNTLLQEEQFLSMDPEQLKPAEKTERQSTQHIKPFILTRDAAQAAVFGAGYPSLPTMTIDQLYEQEVCTYILTFPMSSLTFH